jgi:transcriptional regulator with XRE-family HTH domain
MSYSLTQTEDVITRDLSETLREEFQDEDYRYAYDEEFANARIATQIKVIREAQEMRQKDLAEKAGMKQSRISELENVNYSMWSISTLRRLARALGVRLAFRFEGWGELLPQVEDFGRRTLERPRFEDDPAFTHASTAAKAGAPEGWARRLSPEHRQTQSSFFNRLEGNGDVRRSPQEQLAETPGLGALSTRKSA